MSDLASFLPALAGAVLGAVALVSAHVSLRHLRANQKEALIAAAAEEEAEEPHLPMSGMTKVMMPIRNVWYGGDLVTANIRKRENAN